MLIKFSKKNASVSVRGFSLVELMISIAIIAIMTAIITTNFTGSRQQSRDGQRVSDIGQIQLALSLYFDRCGIYPSLTGSISANDLISSSCPDQLGETIPFTSYISKIPVPPTPLPSGSDAFYDYVTNSSATDFVLHAQLEGTNSSATKNSLLHANLPTWFASLSPVATFDCDSTVNYCVGSK